MSIISRTGDIFYAFRFLRLLTTPWEKTGAYKAGILDKDGNVIKKPETSDEKSVYNIFHRLVFNVKRTLNKIPFGKSTIASYLAALYLIKETAQITDEELALYLSEHLGYDPSNTDLLETFLYTSPDNVLNAGCYILVNEIAAPKTGEVVALKNSHIIVEEDQYPIGEIFNIPVYSAYHPKSNQTLKITPLDIKQ